MGLHDIQHWLGIAGKAYWWVTVHNRTPTAKFVPKFDTLDRLIQVALLCTLFWKSCIVLELMGTWAFMSFRTAIGPSQDSSHMSADSRRL